MDIFLQVIVTGMATGGVYGLIALGFVLIFKATGILNLATGAFMTLGAYICLTVLENFGAPFWVAFLCTLAFAILLGIVLERIVLRPLIGEPIISVVMVTIGLSSILQGLTHIIWSPDYRSFPEIFPPGTVGPGFCHRSFGSPLGVFICRNRNRHLYPYLQTHPHRRRHAGNRQ